ncbi:lysophospholipase, partial [Gammaproteobacteria bacterium]|nr:lysophospholipase [Gammaproteobacteria bacterium]
MEKIALDTNPNSNLHFELYQSREDSIFGLVQISHGMAEHKGRYREFINFLNLNGFHVVIHDHRGHGERIFENKIGFFDQEDGWNLVVNDLLDIHLDINKRFPNIPKILLGHSMGSWIGLAALQQKNLFDAAMLSGSSYPNSSETFMQKLLLKIEMFRLGKNGYSRLLHRIIFGGFNNRFQNTNTPNDWLSQ